MREGSLRHLQVDPYTEKADTVLQEMFEKPACGILKSKWLKRLGCENGRRKWGRRDRRSHHTVSLGRGSNWQLQGQSLSDFGQQVPRIRWMLSNRKSGVRSTEINLEVRRLPAQINTTFRWLPSLFFFFLTKDARPPSSGTGRECNHATGFALCGVAGRGLAP